LGGPSDQIPSFLLSKLDGADISRWCRYIMTLLENAW
jgi:hypothetical protein